MSKIKNGGLDQYGAEPFEQQQFGTAGVEGINFLTFGHSGGQDFRVKLTSLAVYPRPSSRRAAGSSD